LGGKPWGRKELSPNLRVILVANGSLKKGVKLGTDCEMIQKLMSEGYDENLIRAGTHAGRGGGLVTIRVIREVRGLPKESGEVAIEGKDEKRNGRWRVERGKSPLPYLFLTKENTDRQTEKFELA